MGTRHAERRVVILHQAAATYGTAKALTRAAGLPVRDRCLVMGILNVTPDSFSDGGRFADTRSAIARGLELAAQGADIVDVGCESTRPGALSVPLDECARVVPVIRELAREGVVLSVDTMHAATARAALDAGARLVNDVSGGLADPLMARMVAAAGVPYVAMHWRAPSDTMMRHAVYGDVVAEVCAELRRRVEALTAAGVDERRIVLDPGLGFAKRPEHDWALLSGLAELRGLALPVLIGASRKSFLGALLGGAARPGPRGEPLSAAGYSAAGRTGLGQRGRRRAGRCQRRMVRPRPRCPIEPGRRPRGRRVEQGLNSCFRRPRSVDTGRRNPRTCAGPHHVARPG